MQIEISFAAAYDFNQYTQYVPRPIDFWPWPSPPRPVKKIASPSIPAVLGPNELHWALWGCTGVYWIILGHTGPLDCYE